MNWIPERILFLVERGAALRPQVLSQARVTVYPVFWMFSMSTWVSYGFSGFLPPPKSILVALLASLLCLGVNIVCGGL